MARVGDFFESPRGKQVAIGVLVVGAVALFFAVRPWFRGSEAAGLAGERTFICEKTGKPFEHTLTLGETIPVKSPHSKADTGYPAELCYWTREGSIKKSPTAVLVKSTIGAAGPTFCADCGRLVVGRNPRPQAGDSPPPTEAEYKPKGQQDRQ